MKRFFVFVLVVALIGIGIPTPLASAGLPQGNGQITGNAKGSDGKPMANTPARLRNVANGQLAGTTYTSALGDFGFTSLNPGNYIVEVVDTAGRIIGTSAQIALAPGTLVVGGVGITTTVAGAAGAATAAAGGSFFKSTAGVVLLAAAGAGVVGAVVATGGTGNGATTLNASPSK